LFLLLFVTILFLSCDKDNSKPEAEKVIIEIKDAFVVRPSSIDITISLTITGNNTENKNGFCWNTNPKPIIVNEHT
jgi:hypothetical protein